MYHCGTAPALHHIGNGMYGAVIIDPPTLAPVDHEYALVQSELYLGPEGEPGDLAKMQATQADAVVFNGYSNQYKDHPIRVEPNERVRVWVLDAGPSENSAFHIVGTDLRHRLQGRHLPPAARRAARRLAGARPPARTRRLRGVQPRPAGPLPDRHAQVRQRREGRTRTLPGGRGRAGADGRPLRRDT